MRSKGLWLAVLALLIAALVFAFVSPQTAISPGALLDAHHSIGNDCFACHTPLLGSRQEKCVRCHTPDRIGLVTTSGQAISGTKPAFHQHLIERNCTACHTEHRGTARTQATKSFSHELLAPQVRADCASCHVKPQDSLHRQIKNTCQQCHRAEGWRPARYDHARLFVLEGEHNAACATCHVGGDFSRYTCYGCHEHAPADIRAEHIEEGIREFGNCVRCHRSADEHGERGQREGGDSD